MWDDSIQYLSVGTLTLDGDACTDTDSCVTACHKIIAITYDRPVYLETFGMISGLVQTSSEGSHLCKFQLTVTYKGTEQDLEFIATDKIELAATVMITRPADKIELKSKCGGSAKCVFTVEESDVATWSGLTFQGATQILFDL